MAQTPVDDILLNFNQDNVFWLNVCLAFIMYGVALELKPADFLYLIRHPKSAIAGVVSQFLALPLLTYLLILLLEPTPSIALGMMLVAACPGGNVSNFMSAMARGNIALSVSLTAFSTALSIVMTPFNLAFWAGLYEPTAMILRQVSIDSQSVFETIALILGVPLLLGMLTRKFFALFAEKAQKIIKPVSILIFAALIVLAIAANLDNIVNYLYLVLFYVLLHNALALGTGYSIGKLSGLQESDCRSLSIETGIQNSGLGLLLIFSFFDGLGGMALVAAWWGIWHLIAGLTLATYWSRQVTTVPS